MTQPHQKTLVFDNGRLPLFVHAVQSADAFGLAQKVWEANARTQQIDEANHKEYMFFSFNTPDCMVWLQRDQGRTDTFELIMMWDTNNKDDIAEIYVILTLAGVAVGDDSRAKSLLSAILSRPAVVPVNQQAQSQK